MMIGTVMMSNTIQQPSQQQQQLNTMNGNGSGGGGTTMQGQNTATTSIGNSKPQPQQQQQHHVRNYNVTQQKYEAQFTQQSYISDTDMSEVRSTTHRHSKVRSSNYRQQQQQLQQHQERESIRNGSVVSFDVHHQSQQHQSSSRRHHRRHHTSGQSGGGGGGSSSNKRISQSSRHNSQRSVNFDAQQQHLKSLQQGQQPQDDEYDASGQDKVVAGSGGVGCEDDERIQVQILPQDDNWGENTTAYTAATSEVSDFNDDMTEDGRSRKDFDAADIDVSSDGRKAFSICRFVSRYFGFILAILVIVATYVTPILFIVLPRVNAMPNWQVSDCGIECEGLLIGIAFKLFLLLLGVWALYLRKPKATMPRVYELRVLILFLLCILTISYWLFYGVRIIDTRQSDYYKILQFTVTYVDVLLFIYIIAVFILEIRQLQPQYVIKVVRSPDGEQREYTIGKLSIQRAAVWLLEQYYKDFPVYNPWLENAHKRRVNIMDAASIKGETINETNSKLKFYDIDGNSVAGGAGSGAGADGVSINGKKDHKTKQLISLAQSRGGGGASANERFYEEYEYERRLRKRRVRLLSATEDAFTHIKRIQKDIAYAQTTVMDPYEAAQAVFTSIARDLRRYLRITRQQPYFPRESIVTHLANCISYDMSPKSFLQRYFHSESLIFNHRALCTSSGQLPPPSTQASSNSSSRINFKTPEQSWILVCDTVLYQNVEDNLMLVLKQNEITLMCTFKRLPQFNLIEDVLDVKRNKFVLKMNSETSV